MEHDFPASGSRNQWPWRKESRKDCYCKKYLTKFACWVFCVCTKYCWKSLPKNNFIDLGFRGCGFREIDFLIIETFAFKWESPPSYSRWLTLPGWIPKKSSRTQQYYSYVNFICHPKLLSIHELLFGLRTNFLNETKQNTLSNPRALHGIFRNIWNQ